MFKLTTTLFLFSVLVFSCCKKEVTQPLSSCETLTIQGIKVDTSGWVSERVISSIYSGGDMFTAFTQNHPNGNYIVTKTKDTIQEGESQVVIITNDYEIYYSQEGMLKLSDNTLHFNNVKLTLFNSPDKTITLEGCIQL